MAKEFPDWNFHVLTNSYDVEEEYRIPVDENFVKRMTQYSNLKIHTPNPVTVPKYIPKYWPMSERLISLGIKLVEKIKPDVIDAGYFLPYVFVGWVLHKKTKIPFVIRHAGSDIERILRNENLSFLYREIISDASGVITSNHMRDFFTGIGADEASIFIPSHQRSVPLEHFNPSGDKMKIGGLNSKFKMFLPGKPSKGKGVYLLIRTLSELKKEGLNFSCLFTAGPKGKEFLSILSKKWGVKDNIIIHSYFPPWIMPLVYRGVDIVVCPEHNFGIESHGTMIPREALATGTPVIISEDIAKSFPYSFLKIPTFQPQKTGDFKEKILDLIRTIESNKYPKNKGYDFSMNFENIHIEAKDTMKIYQEVMG